MEVNELRRRMSMVFQQPNPFPMSIYENVAYALREEHAPGRRRRRRSRRELEPEVIDALRRAGLYDEVAADLDHPALRLSGGQQQRLCIARALAVKPEVLLLDEPCSALDPISTATIEQLIVGLRTDVAIVIVTHNLQQAMRVADHVAFMHLGELVEYGTARAGVRQPAQSAHARLRRRGVRVRRAAALAVGALALAGSLSGCETTAEKSAQLERTAHRARPVEHGLTIARQSSDVRVLSATIVHGGEGSAAVVTLRNDSEHTLKDVPIAITVKDAHGSTVFQNNTPGLEAALTSLASLASARRGDVDRRPGAGIGNPGERERDRRRSPDRERLGAADRSSGRAHERRRRRHGRRGNGAQPLERHAAEPRRLRARAARRQDRRGRPRGAPGSERGRVAAVSGVPAGQPERGTAGSERSGDHIQVSTEV